MADDGIGSRSSSQLGLRLDGETERSIIGMCLVGGRAAVEDAIGEGLRDMDFSHEPRAAMWRALVRLSDADRHIDTLAVVDDLQQAGELDAVGGAAAVAQLSAIEAHATSSAQVTQRARQVVHGAAFRRISEAAQILQRSAMDRDTSPAELLAEAQEAFGSLNARTGSGCEIVDRADAASRVLAAAGRNAPGALPTGFRDMDTMLRGGLRPGHLVIIAARPAMGKTAFALAVGSNIADDGIPVGVVSLEMTADELIEREISSRAKAAPNTWGRREEGSRAAEAAAFVAERPLHIIDRAGLTLGEVCAAARRMKARNGIGALIVDHIGLINASDRYAGDRNNEVAEISKSLRALASHLNIPVVALSQLNRSLEKRNDKRPNLSDLRDSGAIEQDANVVMFLHRPEYFTRDETPSNAQGLCEVIVAKNRGGATGVVKLKFIPEQMRFVQEAA